MTTTVLNYSRNLLDVIVEFFSAFSTAVQVSRQIETNQKLAKMLRQEYPHETHQGIVAILNDKTLREYYK